MDCDICSGLLQLLEGNLLLLAEDLERAISREGEDYIDLCESAYCVFIARL